MRQHGPDDRLSGCAVFDGGKPDPTLVPFIQSLELFVWRSASSTVVPMMLNSITTLRYIDVNEEDKRQAIALVFGGRASHAQADSDDQGAAVPK
jgi:hypothetical protein